MALTQRLEIRQSQALVMTPQLMQAIKLLQLSNLDLAAYVEGELERNPLLERSEARSEADGERTPTARRRRPAGRGRLGRRAAGDGNARPCRARAAALPISTTCRPPTPTRRRSRSNGEIAGRLFRMGRRRHGRPRRRRLQSRSLRLGRDDARRSSRRAARARDRRSGAPHDRAVPHRSRRRGRLSHRRSRAWSPRGSARRRAEVEAVLAILQGFDPPGVCARNLTECLAHPAQGARPLRSGDGRRWSRISTCWPGAISPRLRKLCGVERGGSRPT